MRELDNKLIELGFAKLQEKEDMVFYENLIDSENELHQICIMYDKLDRKIKSMDIYSVGDTGMLKVNHNDAHVRMIKNELKDILSS